MPSSPGGRPVRSDHTVCEYCETRLLYPRLATGKAMPPVDYGPDPIGTIAVKHTAAGAYVGRYLAKNEQPIPPETRHALHHCEGSERRHTHRRGTSANRPTTSSRPRHTPLPTQPTLI